MTVDIRYTDAAPEQFQRIRMITFYPHRDASSEPQIVMHPDEYGQHNIPTRRIQSVTITRD